MNQIINKKEWKIIKKVSIIIPTFKRSDKIQRAIDSALRQDYDDFEVIVVDDNDPNSEERVKTEKIINKYLNIPNFIYIKHNRNKNGAAARNTGIEKSNGDYITFLDDDDEYYKNKIFEQVKALEKLSYAWGICYTGYDKLNDKGFIQKSDEKVEGDLLVQALSKNLFIGSGSNFMIRREIVCEVGGFDESFERNQDLEFLVRVLKKYKMKYIDKNLFLIHYEKKDNNYNYEFLINVNNLYRKKFNPLISDLKEQDKIKVYKCLDLIDLRTALVKKEYIELIKIFIKSDLNITDVLKYCFYLFKRLITKKSYGFQL